MLLPSEIEAKSLIPAIRSILAKKLVEEKHFREEEVAKVLGITQAAVSNYIRGTRGDSGLISKLTSQQQIMRMIQEISDELSVSRAYTASTLSKFSSLCNFIRYSLIICDVHHTLEGDIDQDICDQCKIILTGIDTA
jgi:predicted transcriptional regulator